MSSAVRPQLHETALTSPRVRSLPRPPHEASSLQMHINSRCFNTNHQISIESDLISVENHQISSVPPPCSGGLRCSDANIIPLVGICASSLYLQSFERSINRRHVYTKQTASNMRVPRHLNVIMIPRPVVHKPDIRILHLIYNIRYIVPPKLSQKWRLKTKMRDSGGQSVREKRWRGEV